MSCTRRQWFSAHPRCSSGAVLLVGVQTLALIAVCTAPVATASTNGFILNWTGLTDSYGVPLGDYYLAIASAPEQITQAGPGVSVLDPDSWIAWSTHAGTVLATYVTVSTILTAEAGFFIGIVALALWVMKLTLSTYWITVIGEIARAIAGAVLSVTTELGLLLVAIPVGVFAGVVTIKRGEAGRGATMILLAVTMPTLTVAVFSDPAGQMYGPHGILAFARSVGFSVGQAATHNGPVGTDTLTASLITHTVREPLQLWNFGHVVDRVGGCGPAWSAAVRGGLPDGPIRAMGSCGDRAAVAYAQHLDGSNIWVGAVLVLCGLLLGFFMVAAGWAVLTVSVKAIWTTVIVVPTLWLGAIPGAPQRRAADVVWRFFRHGIEVLVYIVFVSVIGLALERVVAQPLPAQLGGDNPFAHVLMMGGVCVAAYVLLRHIRADLSDRPSRRGMFGRAADVAVGLGLSAAVGGAGSAALAGGRSLLGRQRGGATPERTPWEQLEAAAVGIHGRPEAGVDPVPGAGADGSDPAVASAAGRNGAHEAAGAVAVAAAGVGGVSASAAVAAITGGSDAARLDSVRRTAPRPARRRSDRSTPSPGSDRGAPMAAPDEPAAVAPIASAGAGGFSAEPLPPEPPPKDEPPPPPDEGGPPPGPATTVNPITEN
jgi:hypothetical protein